MQGDRFLTFLFVDLGKACGRIDPVNWCFKCVDFDTLFNKIKSFILVNLVGIGLFAEIQESCVFVHT